ncbi:MAG: hypothetical protein JJ902_10195 [Roseibium sp.]|nr:hypothetical protein [Roseibium sp.]
MKKIIATSFFAMAIPFFGPLQLEAQTFENMCGAGGSAPWTAQEIEGDDRRISILLSIDLVPDAQVGLARGTYRLCNASNTVEAEVEAKTGGNTRTFTIRPGNCHDIVGAKEIFIVPEQGTATVNGFYCRVFE